jgi:MacB-like periplasmic core domain
MAVGRTCWRLCPKALPAPDTSFLTLCWTSAMPDELCVNFQAFTAVVIITLAHGIGANAAVFTVINSLILNPLPVERISTLVALNTTLTKKAAQLDDLQPLSFPNFRDLGDRANSFTSLAAHSNPLAVTMIDKNEPHRVFMELVTANYFNTLGLHRSQGRFFLPDEDAKSLGSFHDGQDVSVSSAAECADRPVDFPGDGRRSPSTSSFLYACAGRDENCGGRSGW